MKKLSKIPWKRIMSTAEWSKVFDRHKYYIIGALIVLACLGLIPWDVVINAL